VQHPADNWALQDERLTLECKAEGVPTPSVTWWHDNRPLLFDGSTAAGWELRGSRLLCKKLTLQHAGYYWCNARNSDGEVQSRHANLKIDGALIVEIYGFKQKQQTRNRAILFNRLWTAVNLFVYSSSGYYNRPNQSNSDTGYQNSPGV
jgi:hypothetical protein